MKKLLVVLVCLSAIGFASERVKSIYHAHKLSERTVAVSCDEGTPTSSRMEDMIVITCK